MIDQTTMSGIVQILNTATVQHLTCYVFCHTTHQLLSHISTRQCLDSSHQTNVSVLRSNKLSSQRDFDGSHCVVFSPWLPSLLHILEVNKFNDELRQMAQNKRAIKFCFHTNPRSARIGPAFWNFLDHCFKSNLDEYGSLFLSVLIIYYLSLFSPVSC